MTDATEILEFKIESGGCPERRDGRRIDRDDYRVFVRREMPCDASRERLDPEIRRLAHTEIPEVDEKEALALATASKIEPINLERCVHHCRLVRQQILAHVFQHCAGPRLCRARRR